MTATAIATGEERIRELRARRDEITREMRDFPRSGDVRKDYEYRKWLWGEVHVIDLKLCYLGEKIR